MAWRVLPFLIILICGCAGMQNDRACFAHRPSLLLPDRQLSLSHISGGNAARALAEAVWDGEVDKAEAMLRADPRLISASVQFDIKMQAPPPGQYGDLLTFAVARCDLAMIEMLLANGMPAGGIQKGEALILALLANSPTMADMLLLAGASPDPQKTGGKNVVHELSAMGAIGGIQTLIRHGLDLDWVDAQGNDHLDTALTMEQYAIAEHLIKAGAKLWRINGAGALSAWTLNKPPVLSLDKTNQAARERLLTQAKNDDLPWPPPNPVTVRKMVLAQKWPLGVMVISKEAAADLRERFGDEAE
jgi:hypothetical protein